MGKTKTTRAPRTTKPRAASAKTGTATPKTRTAKPAPATAKPAASRKPSSRTSGSAAATRKTTPKAPPTRRRAVASKPALTGAAPARRKPSRAPKPKAMEVLYSGKVFRSRLEARWAVFLDLAGINWDYEPCHYEIGPDLYYLPDFYLPDHQTWLEVKGAPFMDAASYAKVLGAVAGPHRIPLREHPYTPSEKLLLGGPFRAPQNGLTPVHTLVTPAGPGRAALSYAVFTTSGDGGTGIVPAGEPWAAVDATGAKASRRPTPERLAALLEPAPHLGAAEPRLASAYDAAYRLTFDETTRRVTDNASRTLLASLAHRRSGRPLGIPSAA